MQTSTVILEISMKNVNKLKINLLLNPIVAPLGICPKDSIFYTDTCSPALIAILFTATRTHKQHDLFYHMNGYENMIQ